MGDLLNRSNSFRKAVRPIIDRDEMDDDQRRDVHGRKRVDVVDCLLDSSSDETEESIMTFENTNPVLWLTFSEVCHIRSVLAQTTLSQLMLSDERQALKICNGRLCFRCRKTINDLLIFITFLRLARHYRCFICRQTICKNCAHINFATPSSKLPIAVRIQTLIKPSTTTIDRQQKVNVGNKASLQTVCYDCLEVSFHAFISRHFHSFIVDI